MEEMMIDDVADRLTGLSGWIADLRKVVEGMESDLFNAESYIVEGKTSEAIELIHKIRCTVEDI